MINEVIEYAFKLTLGGGTINPADISEQLLMDVGIVDEENPLDKGLYRVGTLGSNITLLNDSEDEIKVQSTEIYLQANYFERFKVLLEGIKQIYPDSTPHEADFYFDIHLRDKTLPESVFDGYDGHDGLKLDIIRYDKAGFKIAMYNCSQNTIHLRVENSKRFNKKLADIELAGHFDFEEMLEATNGFITKDLSISEPLTI